MKAVVTKHTGSHYLLRPLSEAAEGTAGAGAAGGAGFAECFPAVLKGKIRLKGSSSTNPVAVGDIVEWSFDGASASGSASGLAQGGAAVAMPTAENPAVIESIQPRKNYIIRRSTNLSRQEHVIAANIDQAFIVATIAFPEVKLPFLDRILVTCEVYGIKATILLNKVDLYEEFRDNVEYFKEIYQSAGYEVLEVSARTGQGIEELRRRIAGKVCIFSGMSGTGKSSLIKAVDPSLDPKTGEISLSHLQGKHTTTFYEMFPVATGGDIIDSPGIRSFGLVNLKKEEIALYFPEMLKAAQDCRFTPCTHTHEPGCAVKQAVEDGLITTERYNSYLGMIEEDNKYR